MRRIPGATYRLQFNRHFRFRDAQTIVSYLDALGVTDVYASPYFRARAESTHGYDIANHNSLNPAIGSDAAYRAFVAALHAHDMGQVLDFVPNHMGIGEPANTWWMDVLENGQTSLYADFFDIDWYPLKPELRGKVLLPILGDQYGVVLENGELVLAYAEGAFRLHYFDTALPVSPRSGLTVLERALPDVVAALGADHDATLELQSIMTGLGYLPQPLAAPLERRREWARERDILRRRLATLTTGVPEVRAAIERAVDTFNGTPGDAASFDALDDLLRAQSYRLSFWRTAGEEINYRRFFDINDLAAIRVENPSVFDESHRLLLRLIGEGAVTGLRLDHPDGLWDPCGYIAHLQQAIRQLGGNDSDSRNGGSDTRAVPPFYIVVEKILIARERLSPRWEIDGTTGYEFLNALNGLFVDRASRRALDTIYDGFTHSSVDFRALVYEQKRTVLRTALAGELNVLAYQLNAITEMSRRHRDYTLNGLRTALREIIACFPVYRTYVTGDGPIEPHDRAAIDGAIGRALRLNPAAEPTIFGFIRDVLLLRHEDIAARDPHAQRDFTMKFQQVTGPVMAKGMEDSAFYSFNRLVSLNEVGGEPEQFGVTPTAFHRQMAERAEQWPHSLNATSTHDTKRSEDVRARINVISELPDEWSAALEQWRTINRPKKAILQDRVAPDRNEEYLLYQTLLGTWPLGALDRDGYREFRERIAAYMLKAVKEAKVNTSWINPNSEYDEAIQGFVHAILGETPDNPFAAALLPLHRRVARFGAYNSLSQTLIKLTAPGVPDLYQGTELWDFSLVDPDNRRPVDFKRRTHLLRSLRRRIDAAGADLAPLCRRLLSRWEDGAIKLFLTHRTLRFRRDHPELYREGGYVPLPLVGDAQDRALAFARTRDDAAAISVAGRLLARITPARRAPVGEAVWGDTCLLLPDSTPGRRYRNALTGEMLIGETHESGAALPLAAVFCTLPVALLELLPDE